MHPRSIELSNLDDMATITHSYSYVIVKLSDVFGNLQNVDGYQ
jgi:hypothetical protein